LGNRKISNTGRMGSVDEMVSVSEATTNDMWATAKSPKPHGALAEEHADDEI
jgi:hypothetical protein